MPYERTFDEPAPATHAICRNLRSKAMYVAGQIEVAGLEQAGAGHCWCNQTQNVFGPDSQLVGRMPCNPQRDCYQAVL